MRITLKLIPAFLFVLSSVTQAEDGYDLWLRYPKIEDASILAACRQNFSFIAAQCTDPTCKVARAELCRGLNGLLGMQVSVSDSPGEAGGLVIGTPECSPLIASLNLDNQLKNAGSGGFIIARRSIDGRPCTIIAANRSIGVLYGSFRFLQLLQMRRDFAQEDICESPKIQLRMLNHWDNPGTVERGYAGCSIWKWDELPAKLDERYTDYARACASVGINGMVPNNVNADPKILTTEYIDKLAALANVFRPYGIRVYIAANFACPKLIGGLTTADPLNADVVNWWRSKTDEIYGRIPDFGGFIVKANSEGQPGPYDYGRTHADGADMLAHVLEPHGGIILWRAFVYGKDKPDADRIKQAYNEFVPLDGQFDDNVYVQVKNGPLDFQPCEPVNPLFGAMPKTKLALELQITQEYLGHSTFLCYLAPMWKDVLNSPLYKQELQKTYADKSANSRWPLTAIAGVANTGSDRNWCGHHFAQSNWYAFGRLAWDPSLDCRQIAEEWVRLTFGNDVSVVASVTEMMMGSWQAAVDTMTPLGLNTLCNAGGGESGHYSPAPASRLKFHMADNSGVGYDRTSATGSNAVGQYPEPLRSQFDGLDTCPEKYLLWFHHVAWDHSMSSGRSLWDELCLRYASGVEYVRQLKQTWVQLNGKVDADRYKAVSDRLDEHLKMAVQWRDVCTSYFQSFSGRPIRNSKQGTSDRNQ